LQLGWLNSKFIFSSINDDLIKVKNKIHDLIDNNYKQLIINSKFIKEI